MMLLNRFTKIIAQSPKGVTQILRQQLHWMLLLRVILYTLLIAISYITSVQIGSSIIPKYILITLVLIIYLSSILSAYILMRIESNLKTFGFTQCFLDALFASAIVYFTGISHSIFSSVYFFSIIAGGLILPRKGGLIAASTATLLYAALLALEHFGYTPDYFEVLGFATDKSYLEIINIFSVKGLTFFLAAFLSAIFGKRLITTEEVLSDTIYSYDKLSHLYKMIFDNISTGIITTNDHNVITSANNAARSITGYSLSELIGSNVNTIFPSFNTTSKARRNAIDFTKKDGTKIRVGYSFTSLSLPSNLQNRSGRESTFEDDSKLFTLQDISEIEKLEKQIRQGEKLAAIGMMSASIAHDFRNPLTAISGSAQVLAHEFNSSNQLTSDGENLELTNIILRESNRLISTISEFLKFARPDTANRDWFSLLHCVEEVLQVCTADPKWPETARVAIEIDPQTDIWADEKLFFTVINHLIQNGLAFCPSGHERIAIHAFEKKLHNDMEGIEITIDDNGPGVKEELREKIFEPFFTNRADGTGLGLAIVKQTIEAHKGEISITESELGGAKFTLTIPFS